ncbi:PREDICTED: uncharacterized protein LOC109176524 isoform X1 [Ipomoea nil]|uniref:uncharacterized protein LOC109176524 isoform X1 n=2 Tax=Ipomoea nil TaxID=35883 RepID=UPI000900D392|nr:PREDICTED: uncharacterized protein LOC109176524 isoform X1 [Ipomoea nil]
MEASDEMISNPTAQQEGEEVYRILSMEASDEMISNPTAQQEGEEINISLRITKTVSVKINKSETVGRLKTLLSQEEGIQECLQHLFLDGIRLENDKRLVDCGIYGNTTLNAYDENSVPLRLSVKIPSAKRTVMVDVRAQDTIKTVKSYIEAKENIPSDQYTLFYNGKPVEEDKTLAFLEIIGGSNSTRLLHMISNPRDTLKVSVKTLTGETVETQLRMLYTILDVKSVVESKVGYPVMSLAFGEKPLKDSKTVSYYNIEDGSILEILPPAT